MTATRWSGPGRKCGPCMSSASGQHPRPSCRPLSVPVRPRPPSDLELRRQRAWEQAEEYAHNFMKRRPLAKLARPEGWAAELHGYVQSVAWVQAQLIEGLAKKGSACQRSCCGTALSGQAKRPWLNSARHLQNRSPGDRLTCVFPGPRGTMERRGPAAAGEGPGTKWSDAAEQQPQRFQERGKG